MRRYPGAATGMCHLCSCLGPHDHQGFHQLTSFLDGTCTPLSLLSQKGELKKLSSPRSYSHSIHIHYYHVSGCWHTYFPATRPSVTRILIPTICWNLMPPQASLSLNHPLHQEPPSIFWLTEACPGLSVQEHPKSFLQGKLKCKPVVPRSPFSISLNLWLMHCVLYFPFFHRRMKYFRLQLPWGKSMHAKMLPWSCWNTANSQLHFLCRNLFGCPYPQLICTNSQRDLRLAQRESNLPAYYHEWELHMLESLGLFLSVNSSH